MLLDAHLISNLSQIGKHYIKKADLTYYPKNIQEMNQFLNRIKIGIDAHERHGVVLGNILFSFVSSIEVRDRQVTSRIFEDIFTGLFDLKPTDTEKRVNPPSNQQLLALDQLCLGLNWKISTDLSGNKREKSDSNIGDYSISIKTLKGPVYVQNNIISDTSLNDELNVGSLSFRALFKGLMDDVKLDALKDRRGGLGSATQIRQQIIQPFKHENLLDQFSKRLSLFLDYVYEEDFYIVLKSHYHITFILIPNNTFKQTIIKCLDTDPDYFPNIFYRWENNNLRIKWKNLINRAERYNFSYYKIDINLENALHDKSFAAFSEQLNELISKTISDYISSES